MFAVRYLNGTTAEAVIVFIIAHFSPLNHQLSSGKKF